MIASPHVELAREIDRMQPAGAAEREQRKIAHVDATLHRDASRCL